MYIKSSTTRRTFVIVGALCALPMAHAQSVFPARPITLVHPYAAGGPADTMARALAKQMESRLKQPVIVEAKAGGAATIGTGHVARSKPDGHTLLLGTSAGHVVTPLMQRIPYDGIGDFSFIAVVANQPNVLVAHPSLGVEKLQDLVALARKQPGTLNYASAGTGGATHLGAEAFAQAAQIKITHVPYGGAAPALKDLLGGQVQLGMLNLAATKAFIADGRLQALAYGGANPSPLIPHVPTLSQAGYAATATSTWYTLAAPKGTPADVIETLHRVVAEARQDPAYLAVLDGMGAEQMDLSPAETTAFVKRDQAAMTTLLTHLNLLAK
ncbi:Bug family tripartite tricarboxylate transporter substrate binding protein [Hydrogenophaga sp.]|uniref:Bug family tripartite tricarboxylate transporter substrate binding protein n=1 Tax=Hydrogenophaga sp. TaxID=1904254 RepID=UPI002FC754A0